MMHRESKKDRDVESKIEIVEDVEKTKGSVTPSVIGGSHHKGGCLYCGVKSCFIDLYSAEGKFPPELQMVF